MTYYSVTEAQRGKNRSADDDSPPSEERIAMPADVSEEPVDDENRRHQGRRKPDGDLAQRAPVENVAVLPEVIGEGGGHRRHREEERELRRRSLVGPEGQCADDGGAGAGHAGD